MFKALLKEFLNPGAAYRGAPFWAWNGKLEPEELRRQIRLMHRMGLGGFFMHARVGLATAYLSPEWFACVKACADEAAKLGMRAWLYDEDRWPSGAAGGLVTRNPAYRMRSLKLQLLPRLEKKLWSTEPLAVFIAKVAGATATAVRPLRKDSPPGTLEPGEQVLVFRAVPHGLSDWYNGYTYLDVLNPKAVREFLKVTHRAYARYTRKYFRKTIPGIFSDEPNHGSKLEQDYNLP